MSHSIQFGDWNEGEQFGIDFLGKETRVFGTELIVMLLMLMVNGVFAGYELALASVSETRLHSLLQEHRRGASAALRMKQSIEGSLAVVQLGITLVGAVAAAVGGAGAEEYIRPLLIDLGLSRASAGALAIVSVVVPLTVVTVVFGELVPKVFSLRNKEWVCLRISPAMEWFASLAWPAVWVLEQSVMLIMRWGEGRWQPEGSVHPQSEEAALQELRAVASLARASRLIGVHEERIIVNAARLSSIPVRSIMLQAEYINMLDAADSLSAALLAAHHDMHTRFPVTTGRNDPQAIIGYVNFKDIVSAIRMSPEAPSLNEIMRPLPSLRGEQTVSDCLEEMIHERYHIALVRDADNRVLGLVTLEDMLEVLVGDIADEYDRLPTHVVRTGRGWTVGGGAKWSRLAELSGIVVAANDSETTTVNDWVLKKLGHPVEGGETIEDAGVRLLVRKERRQNVQEAFVEAVESIR